MRCTSGPLSVSDPSAFRRFDDETETPPPPPLLSFLADFLLIVLKTLLEQRKDLKFVLPLTLDPSAKA